jgi:hypothetical protein
VVAVPPGAKQRDWATLPPSCATFVRDQSQRHDLIVVDPDGHALFRPGDDGAVENPPPKLHDGESLLDEHPAQPSAERPIPDDVSSFVLHHRTPSRLRPSLMPNLPRGCDTKAPVTLPTDQSRKWGCACLGP